MTPKITFSKFKKEKKKEFEALTEEVKEKIKILKENKKQAIFFINRKALATSVICQDCGFIFQCSKCEVPLVLHSYNKERKFICHHCGEKQLVPITCPKCQSYKLKSLGIGTEKVALEIKKIDPTIKFQILFSEKNLLKNISEFNEGKIQFLISTEAIFKPQIKKVPCVIVVSIDNLLFLPDYKSEEKTFLILKKLLALAEEELIIQTLNPDNKVFNYFIEKKEKEFFEEELKWRQKHFLPPYWQITKLISQAHSLEKALEKAEEAKKIIEEKIQKIKLEKKFIISQPIPAFIFKEKKQYRFYLFLKMKYDKDILKNISFRYGLDFLSPLPDEKELQLRNYLLEGLDKKLKIDIDPKDLL